MRIKLLLIIISIILTSTLLGFRNADDSPQKVSYQIAVMKYNGGGDWYSNPTSVPNLVKFCNQNLNTSIDEEVPYVDAGSIEVFNYPLIHMTGHGNVVFNTQEAENLRKYLQAGGFLHISDNYGMDKFIRTEMAKVFPELEFIELPFNHPIYHQEYNFNKGLPKIHEHDSKALQGFGLILEGRLICFYDFECDLEDGWEDTDVLQMGANIVQFAFNGSKE